MQELGEEALICFNDGSKLDAGVDVGGSEPRFSKSLGNTPIYQGEMQTVLGLKTTLKTTGREIDNTDLDPRSQGNRFVLAPKLLPILNHSI